MSGLKMAAIALVVAGALALLYGSFSYTRETHRTRIGDLELGIEDRQTVVIPFWAGAAALVAGVVLLARTSRKG